MEKIIAPFIDPLFWEAVWIAFVCMGVLLVVCCALRILLGIHHIRKEKDNTRVYIFEWEFIFIGCGLLLFSVGLFGRGLLILGATSFALSPIFGIKFAMKYKRMGYDDSIGKETIYGETYTVP